MGKLRRACFAASMSVGTASCRWPSFAPLPRARLGECRDLHPERQCRLRGGRHGGGAGVEAREGARREIRLRAGGDRPLRRALERPRRGQSLPARKREGAAIGCSSASPRTSRRPARPRRIRSARPRASKCGRRATRSGSIIPAASGTSKLTPSLIDRAGRLAAHRAQLADLPQAPGDAEHEARHEAAFRRSAGHPAHILVRRLRLWSRVAAAILLWMGRPPICTCGDGQIVGRHRHTARTTASISPTGTRRATSSTASSSTCSAGCSCAATRPATG